MRCKPLSSPLILAAAGSSLPIDTLAWQDQRIMHVVMKPPFVHSSRIMCRYLLIRVAGNARWGTSESGQGYMQGMLWACRYLLRAAGSARGGGTVVSGQGYMQKMLWACLSV